MISISLILLFFTIALIYSSAGFGGGSSYLAVMSLYGLQMTTMRPTSLLCNIVVVIGGTYIFWKQGYLNFKKIIPLSILSIPMAYLGGQLPIKEHTFFILLGISLVVAALLMFFQQYFNSRATVWNGGTDSSDAEKSSGNFKSFPNLRPIFNAIIGGTIGFLSGMVGIGGGIFLSPILHLLKWDMPKNIAATASFFILINSISGLIGQFSKNPHIDWTFALPLMAAVLIGGQMGSRLSALKFNQAIVRNVTAVVVLYAGVNILWTHI
jgi:uncharacterized protein